MPLYPFPSIPLAPGVPNIPRGMNDIQSPALDSSEMDTSADNSPSWGVYDSDGQLIGGNATVTDAGPFTLSFDYRKGTAISDFPIEEGQFASYNKVKQPGNPLVSLIVTGTSDDRAAFLSALDDACVSTDLFSVVTPEVTYVNQSIESYTYQRTNTRGANVLIVELTLKEIRTVSAAYTTAAPVQSPQDPGATPQTNSGKVQPVSPPQSTLKAAYGKLSGLLGGN